MNEVTQGERMARIETEIKNLRTLFDTYSTNNRQDHQIMFSKIEGFVDAADKKYVSQATLTAVSGALIVIFTIISFIFAST
jgi:hypothetical protein